MTSSIPLPDLAPPPAGYDELFSANILFVTGKGGVGKTTVAAALALAARASGRKTLLVEVEGRQGFSRTFDTSGWDYAEREFRPGLWGAALDPAAAVYEYLELFYGLKRVQWLMEKSNAIDFVTAAAPGLRDLLLVGKVYEIEARRREDGRRMYDTIVVDSPPTGRIVPFLQAPEGVTEIVRVGPIKRQAGQIKDMLLNPKRTKIVLATLLEEMPIQETVEASQQLADAGIDVGPVVANQVVQPRLTDDELDELESLTPKKLRQIAKGAGAELDADTADLTLALANAHCARRRLQVELGRAVGERTGLGVLQLPQLTTPQFEEDEITVLADVIADQLGERAPRARDADIRTTTDSRGGQA